MFVVIVLANINYADGSSINVETDKTKYRYGEYMTLTITSQNNEEYGVVLRIINEERHLVTKPYRLQLDDSKAERVVFLGSHLFDKKGKYTIEVDYGDKKYSTEFELTDDAKNIIHGFPTVLSPLLQFKLGITSDDVKCPDNLLLVFKDDESKPYCVKELTASKLVERGWIKNLKL